MEDDTMRLFSKWIRSGKSRPSKDSGQGRGASRCKHDKFRNKPAHGAYLISFDGRVIPLRKENLPAHK